MYNINVTVMNYNQPEPKWPQFNNHSEITWF